MKTAEARWLKMRDLFARATDLPTGQRQSFVENSSAEDPLLRDELIALLHADQCQKKKPLTGVINAELEAEIEARRQALVGSEIGAYRLIKVLGHGGVGTVYLAERIDDPDRSSVALKIVEGALANKVTRRRFADERQILAKLNHPYIARLFDAGDTPQGYPYLVMDFVAGEPLDKYCDRQRLSVRARIELFFKVCDAVQYAHQNLIIHRDLKPANIFVAADGTPKLLDFGIAKLLEKNISADAEAVTQFQDQLLTPEYASPEQVLGKSISTATDVYALGVVLYELLCGLKPFANIDVSSHLEYERIILTQPPAKLSEAIQKLSATAINDSATLLNLQRIAASRNTSPVRLQSLFKGDLDAILLKALRSNPEDRYVTVEQFADDLRNFLTSRPVRASQRHWAYISHRFVVRNALGISVGAIFVGLLFAALALVISQTRYLTRERDAAQEQRQASDAVTEFMVNAFSSEPHEANDHITTAKELLDRAGREIHSDLEQYPLVRVQLLEAIGVSYRRQGQGDKAIPFLTEALQIRRDEKHPNVEIIAAALDNLGLAQANNGSLSSAQASLSEALKILDKNYSQESLTYIDALDHLSTAETHAGELKSARTHAEQAVLLARQLYGPRNARVGGALVALGYVLEWQDDNVTLKKVLQEAVQIVQTTLPALHPDRIQAESSLAEFLLYEGDIGQAAPLIENNLANQTRDFAATSSSIIYNLLLMTELRRAQGRLHDAEIYAKKAVAARLQRNGKNNTNTAYALTTLATIQWQLGELKEAESGLMAALEVYHKLFPPDHLYIASAEYYLAEVWHSQHRSGKVIALGRASIQRLSTSNAPPWRIARTENVLGAALFSEGKYHDAQPLLEKSYQVLSASFGPDRDTVQLAHDRLERFYKSRHQLEKLAALHATDFARTVAKK